MMMTFKPANRASLLVFLVICTKQWHSNGIQVDPPKEIKIIDPGHFGYLEITWTPPARLNNIQECPKLYQLEYFNAYAQRWEGIQTPQRTYSAQFDLMKDIHVRVYTLLGGHCTNNTWVKSLNYTEVVQKPGTGHLGNIVENFTCVFENMEHLTCKWHKNPKYPTNSHLYMYYWHKELENTEECPEYLLENGIRIGCSFTGKPLPDFTDINFCVNGSSAEGSLRHTYASLQIQDCVKPGRANKPDLKKGPQAKFKLSWRKPVGNIPGHCLEWEVQHIKYGLRWKKESTIIPTMETEISLALNKKVQNCFRIRSKLHRYCAKRSIWSEWSLKKCDSGAPVF
ncbi:interleukin-13 receptor subunit alpha-2 [Corythoichthys intestinalis]|uniref:interleukin-13 receptor subunit alpha-2 n=1 Tax=Corythoichthys intestinalis TaxID=161448 RepID=UPI0025A65F2C|nr:interleukin-13 receptor subunit alpha-2 [Corythoichthys intestinalis]